MAHTRALGSFASHTIGGRRAGGSASYQADGMGCRPYRCGDRPGGSQPPVCQRTMLPLQETRKSYHISPPDSSAKRDFLKFRRRSPCQSPTYAPCAHTLGTTGRLALPLPLASVCDFVRTIISFHARRVPWISKLIKKAVPTARLSNNASIRLCKWMRQFRTISKQSGGKADLSPFRRSCRRGQLLDQIVHATLNLLDFLFHVIDSCLKPIHTPCIL